MRDTEITMRLIQFIEVHGYVLCRPRKGKDPLVRVPLQVPTGRKAWEPKIGWERDPKREHLATTKQIGYIHQLMQQQGVANWQPPDPFRKDDASRWISNLKKGFMPRDA